MLSGPGRAYLSNQMAQNIPRLPAIPAPVLPFLGDR
jgi:hypothetical protein